MQISAGLSHGLARTADGRVYSWGPDTDSGSLNLTQTAAHLVPGITGGVVDVDAGGLYSLSAMTDGRLSCGRRLVRSPV